MSNQPNKAAPAFRRVLLKISGEALIGEQTSGIDVNVAHSVAEEIKQVHELGVEVAVVVGGGNIFRGVSKSAGNMDRSSADYIGMLATIMNAVGCDFEGNKGGWRLLRRSNEGPVRDPLRNHHVSGSARKAVESDGCLRNLSVHGQRSAHRGLQHAHARKHCARRHGQRRDRHARVSEETVNREWPSLFTIPDLRFTIHGLKQLTTI